MYKIEKTGYGYKLTFSGYMTADEMSKWVEESKQTLAPQTGRFGVYVDMRMLKPLPPDAQKHMQEGQKIFKQKGMEKSVVILNDTILTMQFKRIAKETGIYEWERYVDASKDNNWEQKGLNWIKKGVDPDK